MALKLYRVLLPVSDIGRAAEFYSHLFDLSGERVSPGRHYFDCEGTILACFDPQADGDGFDAHPNQEHMYFATDQIEEIFNRAKTAGCLHLDDQIQTQPWGERCFYGRDPFDNPFCIVDASTMFTGQG